MIARETAGSLALQWVVRLAAPLVWRSERRMAQKLEGFAATEAGSALDMLKAAELCDDAGLRRLFFRHALDEARHARMFREAARRIDPDPDRRGSDYHLIHATRQNLFENLGLVRFMAFVHLAERSGLSQFRALTRHFARQQRTDLEGVFRQVAREEKFHVGYSGHYLRRWQAQSPALRREVRRALARVRFDRAWQAWRRAGRVIGDLLTRGLLSVVYLVALPLFAVVQRLADPERPGWKAPRRQLRSLEDARKQS